MTSDTPTIGREEKLEALGFKIREATGDRSASRCDRCGQQIKKLGQKCRDCQSCGKAELCVSSFVAKPIRLADVLLALEHHGKLPQRDMESRLGDGKIRLAWDYGAICERWNLRDDDLSRQSDECIDFLFSLLA